MNDLASFYNQTVKHVHSICERAQVSERGSEQQKRLHDDIVSIYPLLINFEAQFGIRPVLDAIFEATRSDNYPTAEAEAKEDAQRVVPLETVKRHMLIASAITFGIGADNDENDSNALVRLGTYYLGRALDCIDFEA